MQKRLCLCALVLFAFAAIPASATWNSCQPPPPSVCSAYGGWARLLCETYCEALNCDSRTPACTAKLCSQVESLFKCATNKDLPCKSTTPPTNDCPCVSLGLFASILNGNSPIIACVSGGGNTSVEGPNGTFVQVTENLTCSENGIGAMISLTVGQAQICAQLLRDAAAARNVVCVQPE